MPFAINRGQHIHYTVEGSGPLVVLQHGLLMGASSWRDSGFVGTLADRFCVACIDSLGHGFSDKPSDPELYGEQQRAGDIVAVIDALGHKLGARLVNQINLEIDAIADRVMELLNLGWTRVRIVTDHGWLLLPGDLPKIDLPPSLVVKKGHRAAAASTPVR